MFGFLNSASAISAAFFIDCAATPALPCADSGRISPTRIWPLPTVVAGGGSAASCCGGGALLNRSELPPQAESAAETAAKHNAAHRRRRPSDSLPHRSGDNPAMPTPNATYATAEIPYRQP